MNIFYYVREIIRVYLGILLFIISFGKIRIKTNMSFKKSLIITIVGVLLTVFGHVLVREWYKPDIRYKQGQWIISESVALTSLSLFNHGHLDAKNIRLRTIFGEKLKEFKISDENLPLKITNGGIGENKLSGIIETLSPGEGLGITFVTHWNKDSRYIRNIVIDIAYNGGIAKIGEPILPKLSFILLIVTVSTVASIVFVNKFMDKREYALREYEKRMDNIINFSLEQKENITDEEFEQRLKSELKGEEFQKDTLSRIARRIFYFKKK